MINSANISQSYQEIRVYINYFEHGALLLSSLALKTILDSYSRSNSIAKVQDMASKIGICIEDQVSF